jgi:hypothetical protein
MRVHVNNGKVDLTVRHINGDNGIVRFYGFLGDNIVEAGLLLGVVICVLGLWFSVRKKERFITKKRKLKKEIKESLIFILRVLIISR